MERKNLLLSIKKYLILFAADIVFALFNYFVIMSSFADAQINTNSFLTFGAIFFFLFWPIYAIIRGVCSRLLTGHVWLPNIIIYLFMQFFLPSAIVAIVFILSTVSSLVTAAVIKGKQITPDIETPLPINQDQTIAEPVMAKPAQRFDLDPVCFKLILPVIACYLGAFVIDASFFGGSNLFILCYSSFLFPIGAVIYSIKAYKLTEKILLPSLIYFAVSFAFVLLFTLFVAALYSVGSLNSGASNTLRAMINAVPLIGILSCLSIMVSFIVSLITSAIVRLFRSNNE